MDETRPVSARHELGRGEVLYMVITKSPERAVGTAVEKESTAVPSPSVLSRGRGGLRLATAEFLEAAKGRRPPGCGAQV